MRNKKLVVVVLMLLTGVMLLAGCNDSAIDIKNVEKVELTFSGSAGSRTCVLADQSNIKESMQIFEKLKTYESPATQDVLVDVSYKITLKDGKIKEIKYDKIRPVSDIFKKVFSSLEVRKQWESIFSVKINEIDSLKLISKQKKGEEAITDATKISKIIESVRKFSETVSLDKKYLALCEVEYYDANEVKLGSVLVAREDTETNELLAEFNLLPKLKVVPADIEYLKISKKGSDKEVKIESTELVQLVLENYYPGTAKDSVISVTIKLKNDDGTHMNGSFYKDNIPSEIEKLLK